VSTVRLAATVILVRPPFEIYLTRRSARSAFAPDAFVFPGGTVDVADFSTAVQARTLGLEPERLAAQFRAAIPPELPSDEPSLEHTARPALFVAALRELFEEAGILPASDADGLAIDVAELAAAEREAVRSGTTSFADLLSSRDWFADARALTLFSHWITPRSEPRRYNTFFFIAAAPPDQAALADASETHDGIWIAPAAALEQNRAANLHLVYPTIKHLERLRDFDRIDTALTFARTKPILTIVPNDAGDDFAIPPELEDAW
jgi:8-oxo-dGTP pyrophosphatase MutT (NUDIX family)